MFKDHVVDLGKLYIAASGARSASLSFRASRLSKLLAYDQIELPNKLARVRTGSKAASQLPLSGFGATWSSGCICANDRCVCFADLPTVLFDPHRHRREPCGRESRAPAQANRLLGQPLKPQP